MGNITEADWQLSERHWRGRYEQLAERVCRSAPGPPGADQFNGRRR